MKCQGKDKLLNIFTNLSGSVLNCFLIYNLLKLIREWMTKQKSSTHLRVAVETDIMLETRELIWEKVGLLIWRRSEAMRLSAVLSSTTTQSALWVRRFRVRRELYGWTTTSLKRKKIILTNAYMKMIWLDIKIKSIRPGIFISGQKCNWGISLSLGICIQNWKVKHKCQKVLKIPFYANFSEASVLFHRFWN